MLGVDRPTLEAAPFCRFVPRLDSAERRLGALYVIEGAALGGRDLGRCLDRLFGTGVTQGRRFFAGRGADTGAAWRDFLARLSEASGSEAAQADIIAAAVETFAVFEDWLSGWSATTHS